jgi:hypothetical protein
MFAGKIQSGCRSSLLGMLICILKEEIGSCCFVVIMWSRVVFFKHLRNLTSSVTDVVLSNAVFALRTLPPQPNLAL